MDDPVKSQSSRQTVLCLAAEISTFQRGKKKKSQFYLFNVVECTINVVQCTVIVMYYYTLHTIVVM